MRSRELLVDELLRFPEGHPYAKFTGTHWRLVQVADSGLPVDAERLRPGVDAELGWLLPGLRPDVVLRVGGLARRHGSIEGNAVYALSRLGLAGDPATGRLVEALLDWQWPDGGWNCDRKRAARHSSFHESAIPGLALATYAERTGDPAARQAAEAAAELLLTRRLFRSASTGQPIHPSWTVLHYPGYWHYDILQGLRLLAALDLLGDLRAEEALDLLERRRRPDGSFSGRPWSSSRQPAAVDWGSGSDNVLLNELSAAVLTAAGRG